MTTGYSFVNAREQAILNCFLRGTAITAPTTLWIGLFGAAVVPRNTAVSSPNFYVSATASNTRVFKVTTNGTTAGSEPAGYGTAGDGQTVADGTAVLTEQTLVMDAIADATSAFTSELSGSAYARVNIGQTIFPAASAIGTATGSQSLNNAAISFVAASANWVPVCGFFLGTATTAGNYIVYGRFTSQAVVNSGQQLQFNTNGLTILVD